MFMIQAGYYHQIGKIFFIGMQSDGKLSIFERTFDRCMGLAYRDQPMDLSNYLLLRTKEVLLLQSKDTVASPTPNALRTTNRLSTCCM